MSGKIYFKYGTMGAGKTLDFVRAIYNYKERGMEVLVYKPDTDTRDGVDECVIKSRTGFEVKGKWLAKDEDVYDRILRDIIVSDLRIKAIFIDECQFLSETQVDGLQKICSYFNVPIMCYGLLVDFQRHLFPGSKRLIELADDKQELIGICHCGRKAKQNARVVNGVIITEGDLVEVGGSKEEGKEDEIYYVALCNECYLNESIN